MSFHDQESDVDPFLCTCGPCKKFWKDNFSDAADLLRESSLSRATNTAVVGPKNCVIKVGDRVVVHGEHPGTVKFVGVVDDNAIAPQLYVGVKLDDNVNSTHNGVFKGKRYFHCTPGHGAMVRYTEVRPIKSVQKTPPLQNNYMFPSWDEVRKRRKERNEKLAELYNKAGISPPPSEYSVSSATPTKRSPEPIVNISDPNDMALKLQAKRREMEKRRRQESAENKEKKEFWQVKQQFGGGTEGERLARTLMKLKSAYNEGLQLATRKSLQYDHDLHYYDDDS